MSNELVANELLAFLQQKLDVMDEVSAVQICATNFSEDDIAAAKMLLYTALNKRGEMVSCRRDGTKKSLQDVITLFKETDPDDVPTFVAKDLNKLPNFLAFVVRVPDCYLHLVMDENFWPQGVVFRRFRGQMPPDSTKTK